MPPTILPELPRAVRGAHFYDVLDARAVRVVASAPVACSACGAARCFVTARRVADGWTVTCVGCEAEGAEARGLDALERLKLEAMLIRPK